jgi:hypothetical protein
VGPAVADGADAGDAGEGGRTVLRVRTEIVDAGVEKGAAPALANALELARPALRTCIELWGRPDAGGEAELEVSIDRKEKWTKVRIRSEQRLGPDVRGCLERVMRRTDFGGEDTNVILRVTVRWASDLTPTRP